MAEDLGEMGSVRRIRSAFAEGRPPEKECGASGRDLAPRQLVRRPGAWPTPRAVNLDLNLNARGIKVIPYMSRNALGPADKQMWLCDTEGRGPSGTTAHLPI